MTRKMDEWPDTPNHTTVARARQGIQAIPEEAWEMVGQHFTCSEADWLENVLMTLGCEREAMAFGQGHLGSDGPGDAHWKPQLVMQIDPQDPSTYE